MQNDLDSFCKYPKENKYRERKIFVRSPKFDIFPSYYVLYPKEKQQLLKGKTMFLLWVIPHPIFES